MSPGLVKMWTSLSAMFFMSLSVFLIYLSRYKLKAKFIKVTMAVFAYLFMVLSGFLMVAVLLGGPA